MGWGGGGGMGGGMWRMGGFKNRRVKTLLG